MPELTDISAVIMAGGKSVRMGRDKALLEIDGLTAVEFQLRRLRPLFGEIILSTNTPEKFNGLGIPAIPDITPDRGPLGGIYTALMKIVNPSLFAIACDMPFVNPGLIRYMVEMSEGYDVIVPETERGLEPLHAIYSRTCIPAIKEQLDGGGSARVISFFPKVKVKIITEREISDIKGGPEAFLNFNTPEDYQKARELLRTERE